MSFLDLLFPKHCVNCRKIGEYVCSNCFAQISFDTSPLCLVCDRPCIDGLTHPICRTKYTIDGSFCALSYKSTTKKLVYSFKYKPFLSDLQGLLLDFLYEGLIQQEIFMKIVEKNMPVVIPIPLSIKKLRNRGYNQAAILAKGIAKKLGLPYGEVLERVRETKPQFGLKREERIKNMKNAFGIKDKGLMINDKSKTAFLVDDVLTTGATLLEAANILKRNGFSKVWGICLARDQ